MGEPLGLLAFITFQNLEMWS